MVPLLPEPCSLFSRTTCPWRAQALRSSRLIFMLW